MIGQGPTLSQAGLATGRLGRRLAWSRQAWLDTEGAFPYRGSSSAAHAAGWHRLDTSILGCTVPGPSCRLPLPMSVCSGGFSIPRGHSDSGVDQIVYRRSVLFGDVVFRRVHWAHAGLGFANLLCQGGHAHGASLHSKMCSRQFVGTGGSDAPRMCIGQLVGEANQQYRSYSVAGPRSV